MTVEASDALTQLVVLLGVVIGNVVGATIIPFIKAQQKYAEFDIKILFKKEFLLTCAGSAVTAFIFVSGSFNAILNQVLINNPITYVAAFGAALGLGFTINTVANGMLPQPSNPRASKEMDNRKLARTMTLKGIDLEKLSSKKDEDDDDVMLD